MADTLVKRPGESKRYNFDFTNLLATGDAIDAIVSISADTPDGADALSIGAGSISSPIVQARISGGSHGYTYEVTAKVTTEDGDTHEDCGLLEVVEC